MLHRDYFNDPDAAWKFAWHLSKTGHTVTDYGKDNNGYYIEYTDHPEYTR